MHVELGLGDHDGGWAGNSAQVDAPGARWLRSDAEWSINPHDSSAAQFSILDQLEGMGRSLPCTRIFENSQKHLHSPSLACRVFLIKKPYSSKKNLRRARIKKRIRKWQAQQE